MREQLIKFQNKAEREFEKTKTATTLTNYILALIVFFSSTLIATFTLPFRIIARAISKKKSKTQIQRINNQNIESILNRNQFVLIDFWAEWCGPCMMMNPMMEEFAKTSKGICVAKINADTNKELLERFKIRGLPHLVLIKNGREIKRHAGAMTLSDLKNFCINGDNKINYDRINPISK